MTPSAWLLPFTLQGLAMGVDEFLFHRRREVPVWEWRGHVLDTSVFLVCLALPVLASPSVTHLRLFGGVAIFSCLLITKDEFVHQRLCGGGEHWMHAVLFLLHPVVLAATAWMWIASEAGPSGGLGGARAMLGFQVLAVAGFLVFQILWGAGGEQVPGQPAGIDNSIYDDLGEKWYAATDDPVALLRAESRLRTGWILSDLRAHGGGRPLRILDVACGGGFLANPLAAEGHKVTGIDLSIGSLGVAQRHDATASVDYLSMDARELAFPDAHFDVVCMMDFLEHVKERDQVIREASRVLKPGGRFFFHTFNRTPLSWLIAIKGVEWFVKNAPKNLHVYDLFLKPSELRELCARNQLSVEVMRGVQPRVFSRAFFKLLLTARVGEGFQFRFTRSRKVGYCGFARKADS